MKFVATVATLLIAAAGVITFEACNKKNEVIKSVPETMLNKGIVYQTEVPNREDYILEFEKKLQSAAKSDEVLTVENANAFMFDILNFDYCNINGDGPDKTYETSTYTLNVSNGAINLSEFANLYTQISSHVYDYYHSLNAENANYYCIEPEIAEFDANATTTTVSVKTTLTSGYSLRDGNVDPCDYFTEEEYQWEDAADTLTRYLNMFLQPCMSDETGRCYFTSLRSHTFYFMDNYFVIHPQVPHLYYCLNCTYNATISQEDMCQFFGNYCQIAFGYAHGSCVMHYNVIGEKGYVSKNDKFDVPIHHMLDVDYADVVCTTFEPRL